MEDESEREIRRLLRNPKSLFITCWNRLDLPPSSDASEVTKAYRRLSLLVHPDKVKAPRYPDAALFPINVAFYMRF